MAGNSGGSASSRAYEKRTMDYFDRLPRSVRVAVANARFDWTVHGWLMRFERGQIKAAELVKYINEVDRTEAAKKGDLACAPRQPRKVRR